ncbi:MAG TPA: CBS domain-containing protein [Acidimicrobiales bacterium]|nr:CBS domain-containing protein [Acidimicrobiales bacterium]
MSPTVRDVMTADPVALEAKTSVTEAARKMKERDIGDVIVLEGDSLCGVVTDRDIVVRALAEERDPGATKLGDICSREVVTVAPGDDLTTAGDVMRQRAIRRVPVVEGGRPVGILSMGDLAVERDPNSALGQVSAASPNT